MNRACAIRDEQLVGFAGGGEFDLDEHISTCEECQDFLAELWAGEPHIDLVEPVTRYLRFELFLIDAFKLAGDVAVGMGRAARVYGFGGEDEAGSPGDDSEEEAGDA